MEKNIVHNQDCLEGMKQIEDKVAQVTFWDAPYNIGKADWDLIDDYVNFCGDRLWEAERITKDSGSVYICHNDLEQLVDIMRWIRHNTKLKFQRPIIWNKRFKLSSSSGKKSSRHGFLTGYIVKEGKRNYELMFEFVLYYTFDNGWKIREERLRRGLTQKDLAKEVLSESGGVTGWMSNVELGRSYPNEEHLKVIEKYLGLKEEDLIPKYYNQGTHHSVWDIDAVGAPDDHETPKPAELMKTILNHSTDEGDLVLIPFSGGATAEVVCLQMKRDFISFETDVGYWENGMEKINKRQKTVDEFFSDKK